MPGSSQLSAPAPLKGIDEIAEYIKSRYLSYYEASWRLYGFEIHCKYPPVERLPVHLPGMNLITVHEEQSLEEARDDPNSGKTMLTEWMVENQRSERGRDLTYCEFPSMYTWFPDKKYWKRRCREEKIGRLRYVHPGSGETF